MARKRSEGRHHWPHNLYRNAAGTFWFRNPATGDATSLGKNESQAIRDAARLNAALAEFVTPDGHAAANDSDINAEEIDDDGLKSAECILRSAKTAFHLCGIYFLLANAEIVYVGQSIDCNRRIFEHMRDPTKTFDSYYVIECQSHLLCELEARYIAKFSPLLNVARPSKERQNAWPMKNIG
jgi:hypothetical protein